MEELELGPVPYDEECLQVGSASSSSMRAECSVLIRQLKRQFPQLETTDGIRLKISSNLHDFGTYYEVAVKFDFNNEAAATLAYQIEEEFPANWDEISRSELGLCSI